MSTIDPMPAPTLRTTGLSYPQTLFRLLAFVGEEVSVSSGAGISRVIASGTLRDASPLVAADPRSSCSSSRRAASSSSRGSDFHEGEVIGPGLRIELGALTIWVNLTRGAPLCRARTAVA
jgi:hypothetical protein